MNLLALAILLALLGGCAERAPERFLTQEQDQQMREACEKQDCVIVPQALFDEMIRRMQQMGVLSRGEMAGHR